MNKEIKSAVETLANALSNDNLTEFAIEKGLTYSTAVGCIFSSIAFSLTSQIKYKNGEINERLGKIREMTTSSNATDTHDAILQGHIHWNSCDEITVEECEEILAVVKNVFEEKTGNAWTAPVKKSEKELLNKSSTSGRFEAIQMLMEKGIELNEKEQALWDNFQASGKAEPSK